MQKQNTCDNWSAAISASLTYIQAVIKTHFDNILYVTEVSPYISHIHNLHWMKWTYCCGVLI